MLNVTVTNTHSQTTEPFHGEQQVMPVSSISVMCCISMKKGDLLTYMRV
jgi:hypothetical protein